MKARPLSTLPGSGSLDLNAAGPKKTDWSYKVPFVIKKLNMCMYRCVYIYIYIQICVYIYIYLYVCMYVCMYVYTYIHVQVVRRKGFKEFRKTGVRASCWFEEFKLRCRSGLQCPEPYS